jgi:2,5-furandicarboxylate decarboxylase 1
MKDLRDYLEKLSQYPNELLTANGEVSAQHELIKVIYKLERENKRPAVRFNKVENATMPVITNLMASRKRLAVALNCAEQELNLVYRTREKNLLKPEIIEKGPVQELIFKGDDVNLANLPVVTHNDGDVGPYITAGIMTVRDPETNIRNAGVYRLMIDGKNQMNIHLAETSHAYYIYRKYCDRGEHMPIAITIGMHPAAYLGSLSFQNIDVDEYEVMGGLLGAPLELVKCLTVPLEVPAYGEICLEGYIDKDARKSEGPFGEFASLYGGPIDNPVVQLTAITMRKDPIYLDICSGTTEHQVLGSLPRLGQIYNHVKRAAPGVKDVNMPPSGFGRNACYIAVTKMVEGEGANAASAVFGTDPFVRHVVVVDSDINIFDEGDVLRAINLNMRPENCFIIHNAKGSPIDPTNRAGLVTKIAIDATRPLVSKTKNIDFSAGLDEVDLTKIFVE